MSKVIKRDLGAIVTCPKMHEHGEGVVRLSYNVANPLSFHVRTRMTAGREIDRPISYELYRESVHYWLLRAPGGSVHELGETSLKVRLSAPHVVVFKFAPLEVVEGAWITPMFMVGRELLQRFLADTYVAFPAECEYDLLNVDRCIEQLLRKR